MVLWLAPLIGRRAAVLGRDRAGDEGDADVGDRQAWATGEGRGQRRIGVLRIRRDVDVHGAADRVTGNVAEDGRLAAGPAHVDLLGGRVLVAVVVGDSQARRVDARGRVGRGAELTALVLAVPEVPIPADDLAVGVARGGPRERDVLADLWTA